MSDQKNKIKKWKRPSTLTVFSFVLMSLLGFAWLQWGTREGAVTLDRISHERGFAYLSQVAPLFEEHSILGIPFKIQYKLQKSDTTSSALSKLELFENERSLGPAHSLHDDIRNFGMGRFSHWNTAIYFSTSDNSDPHTNGRNYTVKAQWVMRGMMKKIITVLFVCFLLLALRTQLHRLSRAFSSLGSDRTEILWISVGLPMLVAVTAHVILLFSSPMRVNADSGTYLTFSNIRGPGLGWLAHTVWFLGKTAGQMLAWHGMALASVILAGICAFLLMRSHWAAFWVTLLVAFGTEQYVYSSILTTETPILFFSMLFLIFFLIYLKSGKLPFLHFSLLTAVYTTLIRTENIILLGIAISLAIFKVRQERISSQTKMHHVLHLTVAVLIAIGLLQYQCFQVSRQGHGWHLNQPGYAAVAYYDGSVVNASYAGKREMIDVRNPYMNMIRESVWKNAVVGSKIDYPFTANCWHDAAALIQGMNLTVQEADQILLRATRDFYLRDLLWSAQFIGYKIWMANKLYPDHPSRGLKENELPTSIHAGFEAVRGNINNDLRRSGFLMQLSDPFYGGPWWLHLHDSFFEMIYKNQMKLAIFAGYLPLVFLGFALSFFRREKLMWLTVGGLFFLRSLLVRPVIPFPFYWLSEPFKWDSARFVIGAAYGRI
jgi:fumarate reductase subunit D